MRRDRWWAGLAIAGCLALVPVLWSAWTSLCNESCSFARALAMQVLSVALPVSLAWTAVQWIRRRGRGRARAISTAATLVLIALAVGVSVGR